MTSLDYFSSDIPSLFDDLQGAIEVARYAGPIIVTDFDRLCSRLEMDGESGSFSQVEGRQEIEALRSPYVRPSSPCSLRLHQLLATARLCSLRG